MAFIDNLVKRFTKPIIDETIASMNKAADAKPANFDVPLNASSGYPFAGFLNRKDSLSVTFDTLRVFSVNYDVARACINHRKRQIENLEWAIVPKDDKANSKKFQRDIDKITDFFETPSHMVDFRAFIDRIIDDMLVYDAIVLWKDKTYGGDLTELLPVDAATMRIRVTPDGSLPEAPEPAYQQIIKGTVQAEYDVTEMIYGITNPRNSTPYGLSPLESLVIGVDAALKAQIYNSNMLSEGSIPEGFFALPTTWTPDQIKDYQVWFDTLLAGNSKYSSRIKFMPGGPGVGYTATKKPEDMRYIEMEKWLLMKCCALMDVQPNDIGFMIDGNKYSGENQSQLGTERGLIPTANYLKALFTRVIKEDFGNKDLKFEWKGLQVTDDEFELKRDTAMLTQGALTIDELRIEQGLDPFNIPATQKPFIISGGKAVLLEDIIPGETNQNIPVDQPQDPADEQKEVDQKEEESTKMQGEIDEMEKWESKCLNSLKRGNGIPEFIAHEIDPSIQTLIRTKLMISKSREDVKETFRLFKNTMRETMLISKALKVQSDISDLNKSKNGKLK